MGKIEDDWLAAIKQTMAMDLTIAQSSAMPPKAAIEFIFRIPEVSQAFHLRANRGRPLAKDPASAEELKEIADALERVAAWLDDGFHERLVDELRGIGADLATLEA